MMQTPQRPLPGAYTATPATNRISGAPPPRQPLFGSASGAGNAAPRGLQQSGQTGAQAQGPGQAPSQPVEAILSPVERAAKCINDTLIQESRYPELDNYVTRKFVTLFRAFTSLIVSQREYLPTTISPTRHHGLHF